MSIDDRVARLLTELPQSAQFPTQGATLFVDLARQRVQQAYTPKRIVESLLAGRGTNMFYLYRLLDASLEPTNPEVPLIFGSGVLTGIVPSAARGNATSWSPESGVLMDCNAGDYFPSFLKMNGIDHLVIYGLATAWTWLWIGDGRVEFRDATPYLGLDNIDLRDRMAADVGGTRVNSTGRRNTSMMRCCDAETETETVRPGGSACDAFAWSAAGNGACGAATVLEGDRAGAVE